MIPFTSIQPPSKVGTIPDDWFTSAVMEMADVLYMNIAAVGEGRMTLEDAESEFIKTLRQAEQTRDIMRSILNKGMMLNENVLPLPTDGGVTCTG